MGAVRAEKSRAWEAFPEGFFVEPRKAEVSLVEAASGIAQLVWPESPRSGLFLVG